MDKTNTKKKQNKDVISMTNTKYKQPARKGQIYVHKYNIMASCLRRKEAKKAGNPCEIIR